MLVRIVDVERLDRPDRAGARALHPDGDAAIFEMLCDLGDRRLSDEADMRRHPLFAAHRGRASEIEMDLLLAEQKRGAPLAHALGPHAEHPLVELDAAPDIGDRDVEVVDALDLHGWPRRLSEAPRVPRSPAPDQQNSPERYAPSRQLRLVELKTEARLGR